MKGFVLYINNQKVSAAIRMQYVKLNEGCVFIIKGTPSFIGREYL